MSRAVVFRLVARNEYDDAVAWYETQRVGLGLDFSAAIADVLALISDQPSHFRRVRGSIRRAVVSRFPYIVHFIEDPDRVVVLAVSCGPQSTRLDRSRLSAERVATEI
jgi:toxin ParE1/3/4